MPDSHRDEFRKLMRAYAGFQMATALVVASKASATCGAGLVVALLAISVPSTIAYAGLARVTDEDDERNPGGLALMSGVFAFIPSIGALSILLWPASRFAAVAFPVACLMWCGIVVRLRTRQSVVPSDK